MRHATPSWGRGLVDRGYPDLLTGPPLTPPAGLEMAHLPGIAVGRVELMQRIDLEAGIAQQPDALAVALVEVHPVVPPIDPLEAALRALERLPARTVLPRAQ